MNKKAYIQPSAELVQINVKGSILDNNLGNSDHTPVTGSEEAGGQGAKGGDIWDDEEDTYSNFGWKTQW